MRKKSEVKAFDLLNLEVAKGSHAEMKNHSKNKDNKHNKKIFEDLEKEQNDFLEFAIDKGAFDW